MLVENLRPLQESLIGIVDKTLQHRPWRQEKIDKALNSWEGRASEIALALIASLWRNWVNAILNKSSGIDPRIENDVLELVRTVRYLIGLKDEPLIASMKNIQGFDRTNILNAFPIVHLVRIYNTLLEMKEVALIEEIERAIDRHKDKDKYIKQTLSTQEYETWIILASWQKEIWIKSTSKYIPKTTNS